METVSCVTITRNAPLHQREGHTTRIMWRVVGCEADTVPAADFRLLSELDDVADFLSLAMSLKRVQPYSPDTSLLICSSVIAARTAPHPIHPQTSRRECPTCHPCASAANPTQIPTATAAPRVGPPPGWQRGAQLPSRRGLKPLSQPPRPATTRDTSGGAPWLRCERQGNHIASHLGTLRGSPTISHRDDPDAEQPNNETRPRAATADTSHSRRPARDTRSRAQEISLQYEPMNLIKRQCTCCKKFCSALCSPLPTSTYVDFLCGYVLHRKHGNRLFSVKHRKTQKPALFSDPLA